MEEILLIDKPAGITSFDVIRILRRKLGIAKMGNAGTLDPAATGLLIVGVGVGTKKLKDFVKLPKTYEMEVLFGKKTTTGDLEGEVTEEKEVEELDVRELERVLKSLLGELTLPVPLYSAVKIKGTPLYKLARKGIKVIPPKRKTKIFSLKLLNLEKTSENNKNFIKAKIEMKAEKGTYARAVAAEIGKRLSLPATLSNLRRTKIGKFSLDNALKLEEI